MSLRQDHEIISFQIRADEKKAFQKVCQQKDVSMGTELRKMVRRIVTEAKLDEWGGVK